jgi:hypothetical protein
MTVDLRTTAWITADSANPPMSAQAISQVIDPVTDSACRMACVRPTSETGLTPVVPDDLCD